MRICFLFIILFFNGKLFAQTADHKVVSGTKCSILPPDGFVAATNFSGFQNQKSGASIMINEIPAPVEKITEGFTAENLQNKGMILTDKQNITITDIKATLLKISQSANGLKYLKQILIFGDSANTVMITGIYPSSNDYLTESIHKSLLSTRYNPARNDNPLDAVKFRADPSGTDLKLVKYLAGSLIYSTDGKIPTDNPTMILGNSVSTVSITDPKTFAMERLKKLPRGEFNVIEQVEKINIDGLDGYEIIAKGRNKDSKEDLTYQVMLFSEPGEYYIFVGHASNNFADNLANFKKLAKSFTRK